MLPFDKLGNSGIDAVTAAKTQSLDHNIHQCNATTAAFTFTLAAAEKWKGSFILVYKSDTSTNAVTVDGNGSETVNGGTTYSLRKQYDYVLLFSDGTNIVATAGNNIFGEPRINSRTYTTTTGDVIGFQAKPSQGASTSGNIYGAQIGVRVNSTFALTGTGSAVGAVIDVYLKGTTGAIAGDARVLDLELVDDTGSSRTITGDATLLRFRSNISATVTGNVSCMRVETPEGTTAYEAFIDFTGVSTGLITAQSGVSTVTHAIKCIVGSTVFYIPGYSTVS